MCANRQGWSVSGRRPKPQQLVTIRGSVFRCQRLVCFVSPVVSRRMRFQVRRKDTARILLSIPACACPPSRLPT